MIAADTGIDEGDYPKGSNLSWGVFLISVLGLFFEMLLIRWIGTEIRIFAYLQNTVLVACFLGLGLGCFTCRQPIRLRQSLIPLAFLLLLMAVPTSQEILGNISNLLVALGDMVIWGMRSTEPSKTISSVLLGLALTFFLLILIVDIFVPLGRYLGRLLDDHPNTIWAYSVNIAGSLAGIWLFVLLSLFFLPPFTWFLVLGILFVLFVLWTRKSWNVSLALIVAVIALSWFAGKTPDSLDVIWSPYQKLVVKEANRRAGGIGEYLVTVNNTGYQMIADLSDQHTGAHPNRYPVEMRGLSQYDIPLLLHPDPQKFLVVGAGAGNDAAGGLRHGVEHVTAVEIDPAIISIGREYHPEKPYNSPKVRVINDDARSFFATTREKYDVISFGLLDSHTTAAMTNARLDHYVFTRESIARARSLLAEGGIMLLTFEPQKAYIADRMARVLREVFGENPMALRIPQSPYGWGGVMFVAGDLDGVREQLAQNVRLSTLINRLQRDYPLSFPYSTRIATDDWPYIYLEKPRIPLLYYMLAGLMALVLAQGFRRWRAAHMITRWGRSHWHFFFLGAAFLLLEVQNISKASVVLGNTWFVNAVIVSGVLSMALIANWIVHRFPGIRVRYAYLALIVISIALYFVDLAQFAFLPYAMKAIVVGGLTTLPMLFSGIVFVRSFAITEAKDEALGANLIGALVGALLQSVTFVTGIRILLLIVAGLYLLSLLSMPLHPTSSGEREHA